MISANLQVLQTVVAFSVVVLVVILLKRLAVVRQEDGLVFSRLLIQAVLPAMIFFQLAARPIAGRQFLLVLAMIASVVLSLIVAGLAGLAMRLERSKIGVLMITSAFGSTSLMGYPLVQFAFPSNPHAMADAVLTSELGVGLPIFTLCPIIAMYFGHARGDAGALRKALMDYVRSPIFVALVAGLLVSQLHIPVTSAFIAPFSQAFRMIVGAFATLSCLILGVQINFKGVWRILPLIAVSALIQLAFQPFAAGLQGHLYHLDMEQRQVLVLVSSMPPAILGPVFATRFQCDGETASSVVFFDILLSIVTVPMAFQIFAR